MNDPRMKGQEEAEEYNRSLTRFPKITLGGLPVGSKGSDENDWPKKEVRKGRTANPDDPMYLDSQPVVSGIEMAGMSPSVIRRPPLHKQRETTGVDPFLQAPTKRQTPASQIGTRKTRSYDKEI